MPSAASISVATNGITVADAPREGAAASGRRWPTYAFGALIAAWFAIMLVRGHGPAPRMCDAAVKPDADTLVMLSTSWCSYCRRARTFLQEQHIKHCEYDVETSADGRRLFARQTIRVIPIFMLRGDTLLGFNHDEIMQALAAHGLAEIKD